MQVFSGLCPITSKASRKEWTEAAGGDEDEDADEAGAAGAAVVGGGGAITSEHEHEVAKHPLETDAASRL